MQLVQIVCQVFSMIVLHVTTHLAGSQYYYYDIAPLHCLLIRACFNTMNEMLGYQTMDIFLYCNSTHNTIMMNQCATLTLLYILGSVFWLVYWLLWLYITYNFLLVDAGRRCSPCWWPGQCLHGTEEHGSIFWTEWRHLALWSLLWEVPGDWENGKVIVLLLSLSLSPPPIKLSLLSSTCVCTDNGYHFLKLYSSLMNMGFI